MGLQLFVPTYRIEESLAQIRECLEVGWTGLGFKTVEFEEAWKKFTGFPYAHFLNSATAGLHLAIRILKETGGWKDGDEVISSPLTFVSTNHAILYENFKVVFADVDEYLCLDPADIEKKITPHTRAIVFVGTGGNTGRYHEVVELCRKHNLKLILDAAHMTGTRFAGKQVGAEADIAVFSFQAVKNLPTADSGMLCCRDAEHDIMARKLSWLGINKDTYTRSQDKGAYKWLYDVEYVGFKYHGNSIMAAIGLAQLKYVDQDNAYRRQIASWYDSIFTSRKEVGLIPIAPGCEPSRHLYQILVENRDEMILALNEEGIFPGVHYRDNTEYRMYRYASGTCPCARRYSQMLLSLPVHLRLSRDDVEKIAAAVLKYAGKRGIVIEQERITDLAASD